MKFYMSEKKDYDKKREEYIIAKIGCTFIRYNPDKPNFDIFEASTVHSFYKLKFINFKSI